MDYNLRRHYFNNWLEDCIWGNNRNPIQFPWLWAYIDGQEISGRNFSLNYQIDVLHTGHYSRTPKHPGRHYIDFTFMARAGIEIGTVLKIRDGILMDSIIWGVRETHYNNGSFTTCQCRSSGLIVRPPEVPQEYNDHLKRILEIEWEIANKQFVDNPPEMYADWLEEIGMSKRAAEIRKEFLGIDLSGDQPLIVHRPQT